MKRIVFLAAALLAPTPALAAPAYVTCDFVYQGKPQPRQFTINEERGTVTIFYPETAESQTLRANFSANAVLFETYVDRYVIGRSTLLAARQAKLDSAIDEAQCRIETPAKRAF